MKSYQHSQVCRTSGSESCCPCSSPKPLSKEKGKNIISPVLILNHVNYAASLGRTEAAALVDLACGWLQTYLVKLPPPADLEQRSST